MLLCLSSRLWRSVFEEAVEAAGEVALEAAGCFASGFSFLQPSFDVGDGGGVGAFAGDEDHVECAVEFAVAASVEPVADRLPGGGGDRGCAGEACEGGFGGDPSLVRPGEHQLCGRMRSDAGLLEQLRGELASDRFDLACELALLCC